MSKLINSMRVIRLDAFLAFYHLHNLSTEETDHLSIFTITTIEMQKGSKIGFTYSDV